MNRPIQVGLTTPSATNDKVADQHRLPDPRLCRSRYLGDYLPFSDCLVKDPNDCEHVLRAGFSFLCNHPNRRSFEKPGSSMPIQ